MYCAVSVSVYFQHMFPPSPALPGSFKSAIYILLQKGDSGFVDAARNVITSGGDSSSRVNMVGACVGAKYGLSSIPTAWALKTRSIGAVVQSVERLFS